MNDYSHLRLHDTRVARATTRTRPTIPTVRSRTRWHRLLHALQTGTDGVRPGSQGPSRAGAPSAGTRPATTEDPGTAHSVSVDPTGGIDASTERPGAVRVS